MQNNKQKTIINFSISGCGRVADNHLNAIANLDEANLYALCDVVSENVLNFIDKYQPTKTYSNHNELISDNNVDVVIISTPSGLHTQMAIEAACSKKHIILEKPMALSVADATQIIQACQRNSVALSVVYQNRYNSPIEFIKKVQKHLGRLNYISANVFWYRDQAYYQNGWHGSNSMDGGVLLNQGSHYVDMVLYLAEKPVKRLSAYGATLGHHIESHDCITVNLEFEDGTLGNIQANTISYPEDFEGSITLLFDQATIKIGGKAMNEIVYWKGLFESEAKLVKGEVISNIYGNGHVKVIKNMVNHLVHGHPLDVPGHEGIKSLNLIENILSSIQTQACVLC
jgi:UDP-N-acetyl-2-amino-2-deoxyglucuronate dehydrogenase